MQLQTMTVWFLAVEDPEPGFATGSGKIDFPRA